MDKARDQKGVTGHEFTKQAHYDRPSSSASNKAVDVRTFYPEAMDGEIETHFWTVHGIPFVGCTDAL